MYGVIVVEKTPVINVDLSSVIFKINEKVTSGGSYFNHTLS